MGGSEGGWVRRPPPPPLLLENGNIPVLDSNIKVTENSPGPPDGKQTYRFLLPLKIPGSVHVGFTPIKTSRYGRRWEHVLTFLTMCIHICFPLD